MKLLGTWHLFKIRKQPINSFRDEYIIAKGITFASEKEATEFSNQFYSIYSYILKSGGINEKSFHKRKRQ